MLIKYIIFFIVIEIAVIIKGELCLPNLCVPSCPPRPICPPTFCQPPPVCPPPPTCAPCYQAVPIINDCCCSCNICRVLPRANLYEPKITTQEINDNPHCNSEDLKEIMENSISSNPSFSKHAIQKAAEDQLGGNFNVICAKAEISYVVYTKKFCRVTIDDITCYAFKPLYQA